jgi:hypothetical protein
LIFAIVAIIGFSVAACSDKSNDGGGNNPTTPTTPTNPTTPPATQLSGTYYHETGLASMTFSGSNWSGSALGVEVARGTYTVSGNTVTLTTIWVNNNLGEGWSVDTWPGDVWYMTIIDDRTLRDDIDREIYRKS